jgi:hypothetical protein
MIVVSFILLFVSSCCAASSSGFRRGVPVFLSQLAVTGAPFTESDAVSESSEQALWLDRMELPDQHFTSAPTGKDDTREGGDDAHPLLQIPCGLALTREGMGNLSNARLLSSSASSFSKQHHTEPQRTVQAFLDTGAQRTVMSWEAAAKLGFLLPHLDRRYAGRATGVGSCAVVGRIPAGVCQLHLGGGMVTVPSPAILVIESTETDDHVDFLIGLDFLRDHEAIIDMRKEELQLKVEGKDVSITFLRPKGSFQAMPDSRNDRDTHDSRVDSDTEFDDDDEKLDMSGV